jgi:delta14-sterol reductase
MTVTLAGFVAPWILFAVMLALHLVLPARHVEGYVRHEQTGELLHYRLNGLPVLFSMVGLWWLLGYGGWLPWDWLWLHRWSGVAGAATAGVLLSLAVVLSARTTGRSLAADLFFGRRENPQMFGGRADAKMVLYLVGAVLLELNLLSFAAHHWLTHREDPSPGIALYVALFSWFVCEYLFFERVHLYTYDLFAERLGFKLVWGCLAWYPYFYAVGLWSTAELPNPHSPTWLLVLAAAIFFSGWALARGANMQKFAFKRDPDRVFLGWMKPETLGEGDRRILCSGFWGVSRHVNYLGEILMASGLALSLGWPWLLGPWLYPIYYVVLLGTRERDDDRRCAAKYGEVWAAYRERVPWRIVPRIY